MHPYSRDRITLSVRAIFGHIRESLARIEGSPLPAGVYPAARELFAYKPIGVAKVRNISDSRSTHGSASLLSGSWTHPTESQPVYLAPGAEAEIPVMAVFNDQVNRVSTQSIREGNVFVNATPAEEYDDRFQTRLLIHGRNAWDGDVMTLRYFVTPDDPFGSEVLPRRVAGTARFSLAAQTGDARSVREGTDADRCVRGQAAVRERPPAQRGLCTVPVRDA